jgi:hypothetical protein
MDWSQRCSDPVWRMTSPMPETLHCAQVDAESVALVEACSIEIAAQTVLLWVVILPTAIVIFPATLIALGLYMVAHLIGDLSAHLQWIGGFAEGQWWTLLLASGIACFAIAGAQLIVGRSSGYFHPERRLRPLSGRAGEALSDIVAELWRVLPSGTRGPPHVTWFPNFNLLASADESGASQEIQVSSALWERAVRRDPVAIGILAHETAHLVFRDGRRLRPMESIVTAARRVLSAATVGVLATAAVAGIVFAAGANYTSLIDLAWREAAVAVFAALVLLIPFLANLAVRREAALITALIEIRADACAGLWTNGLASFARSLSQDPGLKATSLADVRHSVLSPDLTHVSNSERIALLGNTVRLATPKVRYFALSLALPFLLPLNPFTPLLAAGALDHMLVAAVVVVAHVTTVAMIVSAALALPALLSWRTAAGLAAFLCVATMLPRINLYEIGYLFTHLAAGLASPGGFGREPLTWASIAKDIATTFNGLWEKLAKASAGSLFLLAIICSAASLRALSLLAREPCSRGSRQRLWAAPAAAAGMAAIIVTHDEWRSFEFPPFNLIENWAALAESIPWLRLCAPELTGLLVFALQAAGLRVLGTCRSRLQ